MSALNRQEPSNTNVDCVGHTWIDSPNDTGYYMCEKCKLEAPRHQRVKFKNNYR